MVPKTYPWQDEGADLDVYADSDGGGRVGSRKSTSSGAVLLGAHCLEIWSSTQGAEACSSVGAKFYAMIVAALRTKCLRSLALEMGFNLKTGTVNLWTDITAANKLCLEGALVK